MIDFVMLIESPHSERARLKSFHKPTLEKATVFNDEVDVVEEGNDAAK